MRFSNVAAAAAVALFVGFIVPKADAAYIVTLEQVGSNVVATGSGSLDVTDLTFYRTVADPGGAAVAPLFGAIFTGSAMSVDQYSGSFTGPTNFGSGFSTGANDGGGDEAGFIYSGLGIPSLLGVPTGYLSGASLADTATYDNQTLSGLGVTPGTYTWTWGTGVDADSFTLYAGVNPPSGVPEPASLATLAAGLACLGLNRRRRRKAAHGTVPMG